MVEQQYIDGLSYMERCSPLLFIYDKIDISKDEQTEIKLNYRIKWYNMNYILDIKDRNLYV